MALGNMGLPAGTEVVVPTAGALGSQGLLPRWGSLPAWVVVALVATVAEVAGGSLLYAVGYFGGLPFVQRYGKYVFFREHHLERVHAFYERYGKLTVFWCRFLPFVRGVSAFPAGLSRMQKRYFLTYTAAGSAIFCFGLAYLGEYAGRRIDTLMAHVHTIALGVIGVLLAVAIVITIVKSRAARRAKDIVT
ncbi:MAG: DedA family protein [Candidatus Velthaea sp.]